MVPDTTSWNALLQESAVDDKQSSVDSDEDEEALQVQSRTWLTYGPTGSDASDQGDEHPPAFAVTPPDTSFDGGVDDVTQDEDSALPDEEQMLSFWMHEEEKVIGFLLDRLNKLQQLSLKRIAKFWIKGICPRKQARFPYNRKGSTAGSGGPRKIEIPGWWPDTSICSYTEPDHICKQRQYLVFSDRRESMG